MHYKPLVALALLFPACAWADDLHYPPRRAGLWEGSAKGGDLDHALAMKYCVDSATDQKLMEAAGQKTEELGGNTSVKVDGNVVHISGTGKVGTSTMVTEMTLTYSGDTNATTGFTVVIHTVFDPPVSGAGATHDSAFELHWAGDCPTDMKPGDIVTNGRKHNVSDMLAK